MLGFMNEMARFAEYAIADAGRLAWCDIERLNRKQRRLLHNRDGGFVRPLDLVAERLGSEPRQASVSGDSSDSPVA